MEPTEEEKKGEFFGLDEADRLTLNEAPTNNLENFDEDVAM